MTELFECACCDDYLSNNIIFDNGLYYHTKCYESINRDYSNSAKATAKYIKWLEVDRNKWKQIATKQGDDYFAFYSQRAKLKNEIYKLKSTVRNYENRNIKHEARALYKLLEADVLEIKKEIAEIKDERQRKILQQQANDTLEVLHILEDSRNLDHKVLGAGKRYLELRESNDWSWDHKKAIVT